MKRLLIILLLAALMATSLCPLTALGEEVTWRDRYEYVNNMTSGMLDAMFENYDEHGASDYMCIVVYNNFVMQIGAKAMRFPMTAYPNWYKEVDESTLGIEEAYSEVIEVTTEKFTAFLNGEQTGNEFIEYVRGLYEAMNKAR